MSDNKQNTDYRDRAGINQHEQLSGAIANSNSTGIKNWGIPQIAQYGYNRPTKR